MKIVIDIDDMAYKFVKNTSFVEDESTLFKQTNADRKKTLFLFDILDAIKNGTPLPKDQYKILQQIESYHTKAKKLEYVKNPLAWALYQVWKEVDKAESEEV